MDNDILLKAGKTIIRSFFKRTEEETMDDAELLPLIKDVINGISAQSSEVKTVRETLYMFAQNKFTDLCEKIQIDYDDTEDSLQENIEYFEYVYENEEHPD
jgi:hypothetical protein